MKHTGKLAILQYLFVFSTCFRYELQQRGVLNEEDVGVVPDIYVRNQKLDSEVKYLRKEVNKYRDAAL